MTSTATPPTQTPLQAALAVRNEKLDTALEAYSAAVAAANTDFVRVVTRETAAQPLTRLANEIGMSRQTLHDLVRRHPVPA